MELDLNFDQLDELITKILSIVDSKESNKKDLIINELKKKSFDSIEDLIDNQLTEDYWSSGEYRNINEKEIVFPSTRLDHNLVHLFHPEKTINNFNTVWVGDVVANLYGDPVNIDDLEYYQDRVYGIRLNKQDSQNFGFIIQRVDEDDLHKNLENEDHEVKEYIFLKSNNDHFIKLFELVHKFEFLKILFNL